MSVERVARKDGVVWRVRWRDELGRNRSKVLGRKSDAEAFDVEVRRMKRTRELGMLDGGKQTLTDLHTLWLRLHGDHLARGTRDTYDAAWKTHVKNRLGPMRLRDLDARTILEFRAELEENGVGPAAVRKSLALLHGVLQRGVEWGWIANNPAASIRKPAPIRKRAVTPLMPVDVEALRTHHLMHERQRDATLICVLAYAGLRPGEALALTWGNVGNRRLLVDGAVAYGEVGPTKTGTTRSVPRMPALADDLNAWFKASGGPDNSVLVFPGHDGKPWSREAYKSWARRAYALPAARLKIASTRPYDLRHSFVAADPGGALGGRRRPAGRPRTDDDAQHLRARLRGARPRGPDPCRRADSAGEGRADVPVSYLKARITRPCAKGGAVRATELQGNSASPLPDSNRRPLPYHGSALPTELRGQRGAV